MPPRWRFAPISQLVSAAAVAVLLAAAAGCGSVAVPHDQAAALQLTRPLHRSAGRAARMSADAYRTSGALAASSAESPSAQPPPAPAYFRTLPPGARLPSGAQCAKWVRARPMAEDKDANRRFNDTTGQHVGSSFLAGDEPQADRLLASRITGDFTGTTQEILRWAACKWGIAQNIVFAQAAVESWWLQSTKGDWEGNGCPPGHEPGADGRPGLCPQSWGILQNRYPYETASWPGIERSTAMNADTAYAIWRSCYDGYETWLNTVTHVGTYRAGDTWGCIGRWFAGRWHTAPAQQYIGRVKLYLRERIWTKQYFQQP